jgi:catechol 2,3-dioxygenase-like lactoylglutathione lyase family enzyme
MPLTRLIPMLPVKSMAASVAFYEKLGFAVENRNDQWRWAMLRWAEESSDCRVMLDESINAHPDSPRQHVLYLYPDNVVEYHQQLRDRGVEVPELNTTFYGMTEFRFEDPDGNPLWIGQANS